MFQSSNGSAQQARNIVIELPTQGVVKLLVRCFVFLTAIHVLAVSLLVAFRKVPVINLLNKYFNLNNEANFPTFFSSLILLFSAVLCFFTSKHVEKNKKVNKKYWLVLGAVFLFMCFDEMMEIHERLNNGIKALKINDFSGYFYWIWVVPYTLLFVTIGIYFLRFVLSLPVRTRNRFLLSGFIFFAGAVGIEMIEGHFLEVFGERSLLIPVCYTIQEVAEIGSIILFISALLDYINQSSNSLVITTSTVKYIQVHEHEEVAVYDR